MHKLFTVLALAAVTILPTITACDDAANECSEPALDGSEPFVAAERLHIAAPEGAPPPAEYTFREQGPPQNLVITKFNGATIDRDAFAKLVMSPGALSNPPLTCTLSWYQPDTKQPDRVLGLGCSMMAPFKLWESYRQTFLANGGVQVP